MYRLTDDFDFSEQLREEGVDELGGHVSDLPGVALRADVMPDYRGMDVREVAPDPHMFLQNLAGGMGDLFAHE
jgi:hypothetical protein